MALVGRVLTVGCPCPGTPHETDTVTYRQVLTLRGGMLAMEALGRVAVAAAAEEREVTGVELSVELFPIYLEHAVAAWTFVWDDAPLPVTADADNVLPFDVKYQIADAADDLFGQEITRPLAAMTPKSSRSGRTKRSTSPTRTSGQRRRRPSAPSSPNGSAASGP